MGSGTEYHIECIGYTGLTLSPNFVCEIGAQRHKVGCCDSTGKHVPYCYGLVQTHTHLTYYDSLIGPSATKQKCCRYVCLCIYSHAYIQRISTTATFSICQYTYK